jgi:hypothetical protein
MNTKTEKLSRQKLYELVWSKPTKVLAAEFGISDVMIAKICKKHNIPKPGLGYWARKENGYKDRIVPLPPNSRPQLENIEFSPNSSKDDDLALPESVLEMISREDLTEYKITVSERLGKLHPVLANAKSKISAQEYLDQGLIGTYQTGIHLRVSRENVDRSLKILSAIITAFEKRKFPFSIKEARYHRDPQFPIVTIQDIAVEFRLQERLRKTKINSLDQISDRTLRKQLSYGFTPGKELLIPSGELYIQIETYTSVGCRKLWSDSEKLPLEMQLNNIMKGFITASEAIKQLEEKRDAQHKIWKEERKIAEAKAAERQARADRAKALTSLANEMSEYEKIKTLKVELDSRSGSTEMNQEIKQLLKWAEEYLSAPDPLTKFLKQKIGPLMKESQAKNT